MSADALPPLPESHPYGFDLPGEHPLFKAEQMRAYGQQCRDAALREAAELCDCDEAIDWTPPDIAAVLRAKVKEQT